MRLPRVLVTLRADHDDFSIAPLHIRSIERIAAVSYPGMLKSHVFCCIETRFPKGSQHRHEATKTPPRKA
jgi:hypothetical protein